MHGRVRLRVTVSFLRYDKVAAKEENACTSEQGPKPLRIKLSVLKTDPLENLCKRAFEAYQELTNTRMSLKNDLPTVTINSRRVDLWLAVGEVCEDDTALNIVFWRRPRRRAPKGHVSSEKVDLIQQILDTAPPEERLNQPTEISQHQDAEQSEGSISSDLLQQQLSEEATRLFAYFDSIERFLQANRLLRGKKMHQFESAQKYLLAHYGQTLKLHHVSKLLWLVPDLYKTYVKSQECYIGIPFREQGHEIAHKRRRRIQKRLLKWVRSHGDEPIPERELIPDLHKLTAELTAKQTSVSKRPYELDPYLVLRPEMGGGVFHQLMLSIINRKQEQTAKRNSILRH